MLKSFQKEPFTATINEGAKFAFYSRTFDAGRVELGGNTDDGRADGRGNYIVAIAPLPLGKQPTKATLDASLAARMKDGAAARMAARVRVTYNRLTRDEYVNTVRDLIGVEFDAKDPGNFLEDPEWHGFERLGSVLTLSPSNIEKYLAAAEVILNEAYPKPPPPLRQGQTPPEPFGGTKPAVRETEINERHRERLRELGLLDKVRFEMWPGDIYRGSSMGSLPEAGVYEISYKLSGLRPPGGRAPRLKVYEEKLDRVLFEQDIVADEDKPISDRCCTPWCRVPCSSTNRPERTDSCIF